MIRKNDGSVADKARKIYEERLKAELEPAHNDELVAVEPDSAISFSAKLSVRRSAHREPSIHGS